RIQIGRLQIRDQLHVRLVDGLETADRGAVEELAGLDRLFVEGARGNVEVLHQAGKIAEPDVDELAILLLDVLPDLAGTVEHISSIRALRRVLCCLTPRGITWRAPATRWGPELGCTQFMRCGTWHLRDGTGRPGAGTMVRV